MNITNPMKKPAPSATSNNATKVIEDTLGKLDKVFKMREDKRKSLEGLVDTLRRQGEALRVKNSELETEVRAINAERVRQLEAADLDKRKMETAYQSRVQEIQILLEEEKRLRSSLEGKLKHEVEVNAELNNRISSLQGQISDWAERNATMENVIRDLETSVEERIRRAATEAERMIHTANATAENEKRRLMAQVRAAKSEVEDVKERAERSVDEYRLKVDAERRRTDEIARERDALKSEVDRMAVILSSIQSTVDQLLSDELRMTNFLGDTEEVLSQEMSDFGDKDAYLNSSLYQSSSSIGFLDLGSAISKFAEEDCVR